MADARHSVDIPDRTTSVGGTNFRDLEVPMVDRDGRIVEPGLGVAHSDLPAFTVWGTGERC